jgi:hypothetical protein
VAWPVFGSTPAPKKVEAPITVWEHQLFRLRGSLLTLRAGALNLPGWCWARIKQLALIGSSSSLHSEACKALGGSDGVVHSTISLAAICMRAVAKQYRKH